MTLVWYCTTPSLVPLLAAALAPPTTAAHAPLTAAALAPSTATALAPPTVAAVISVYLSTVSVYTKAVSPNSGG